MRDKKKTAAEKNPEQAELEKHVDAMMDPKRPDEAPAKPPAPPAMKAPKIAAVTAPVSEGPTTAPQLPKPRKQITITDNSTKPLSIDKLDELTKSITESNKPKKHKKSSDKPKPPNKPEEQTPEADITENGMDLDDDQTDKAVDDIVAYEGDVMLAVADSTAEAHNRQFAEAEPEHHHHLFSDVMWALVALVAILVVILAALLVMGDSLANKLGL